MIGAKDQASMQMNVDETDRVTGLFYDQFKTYAICRVIHKTESQPFLYHIKGQVQHSLPRKSLSSSFLEGSI